MILGMIVADYLRVCLDKGLNVYMESKGHKLEIQLHIS